MKKLILLSVIILTALTVKAQRIEATVSMPIVKHYEIATSLDFNKISLNSSYGHWRDLDKFMLGLNWIALKSETGVIIKFGGSGGIANGKSAFDLNSKVYFPINQNFELLIKPRFNFNKKGNYPEIHLGINYLL